MRRCDFSAPRRWGEPLDLFEKQYPEIFAVKVRRDFGRLGRGRILGNCADSAALFSAPSKSYRWLSRADKC
jgi:hypothetical protein